MALKDPAGQPLPWRGDMQAYDIGFSNSHTIAAKHLISYGGSFRHNEFNHSAMREQRDATTEAPIFRMSFSSPNTSAGFSAPESTNLKI